MSGRVENVHEAGTNDHMPVMLGREGSEPWLSGENPIIDPTIVVSLSGTGPFKSNILGNARLCIISGLDVQVLLSRHTLGLFKKLASICRAAH